MSERRSGLRNPQAAVRGMGAGTLILETVVLLLALRPVQQLADAGGIALGVIAGLAVSCVVTSQLLRYSWGWLVGALIQLAVIVVGVFVHWSLVVIGVLFIALWGYVLRVRRTVLSN